MNAFERLFSVLVSPQAAFQGRPPAWGLEETGREIDDTLMNAEVKIALHREPELRTAGIHVATSRRVVQLSGFVESRSIMSQAMQVTRNVRNVKDVKNDMRLR